MTDNPLHQTTGIFPIVTERQCGGYLALTPDHSPVRFAVTGDTRQEAIDRFYESLDWWLPRTKRGPLICDGWNL